MSNLVYPELSWFEKRKGEPRKDIGNKLAKKIKKERESRDWSLDDLSFSSYVDKGTLSRIENSKVSPSMDTLNKIAVAFGISLSKLLEGVE